MYPSYGVSVLPSLPYYIDVQFFKSSNYRPAVFDLLRVSRLRKSRLPSSVRVIVELVLEDPRSYSLLGKDNIFGRSYTVKQFRRNPLVRCGCIKNQDPVKYDTKQNCG